ncbi:MAG: insulinase family protein, partial [Pseudomonadota bacterium]
MKVFASGTTSQLYQSLVVDQKIAASVSGYYAGYGLDTGKMVLAVTPAKGVSLEDIEAAVDKEIAKFIAEGATPADIERARNVYTAEYIYETDSQSSLARRYGWGLVVGSSVEQIDSWPVALAKVTADDVKRVASKYFNINASVTGKLLPAAPGTVERRASAKPNRS